MKLVTSLLTFTFFVGNCYAESNCRNAKDGSIDQAQCEKSADVSPINSATLPEEAMASVKEWNVKMRFFTAIGFHQQAKQKRDAIEAVYREHGLPMPDEYRE